MYGVNCTRVMWGLAGALAGTLLFSSTTLARDPCAWSFPVGDQPESTAPLSNFHPVGGGNLPSFGVHLGADYWSGGACTDFGQPIYAVAAGQVVEIVDNLGSYLDVVVIRHQDPELGNIYSMYGHMDREPGLAEGMELDGRTQIGAIGNVLDYFSPCHLHFELLNEVAYQEGPFCNGCENAGYHVSPGYDQQQGVVMGAEPTGDTYLEVQDQIVDNRWYYADAFIEARLDDTCEGTCNDNGSCEPGEDSESCPGDCPPCAPIPPEGGVIDESSLCFQEFGDPQWWTWEQGVGWDETVLWTTTTDAQVPDNYGIWSLDFAVGGDYELAVYIPQEFGESMQARYEIQHAGGSSEVVVDQSQGGWLALGTYTFDAGPSGSVRLDDNTGEPWAQMLELSYDALRVDPVGGGDGDGDGSGSGDGDGDGDDCPTGALGCMCTSGGGCDPGGVCEDGLCVPADEGSGDGDGDSGESGSAGDTSGDAGTEFGSRGEGEGCACTTDATPRPAGALGWLVLLTLGIRVRRRETV